MRLRNEQAITNTLIYNRTRFGSTGESDMEKLYINSKYILSVS